MFESAKKYIALNQYVSLDGKLDTKQFKTNDGKIRSSIVINVTEFNMSDDSADFINDINSVELLGQISTEVVAGPKFRVFSLSVIK